MGNIFGSNYRVNEASNSGSGESRGSRKRKLEEDSDSSSSSQEMNDELLNTPRKKRIKSTSKYIYKTLFQDEENSDITIKTLGKDWKLHKLYLKQSPYFSSMFSGSWKERDMDEIAIDIADDNIDQESLKIVLGSLYKDDIFIKPVQIVGVVATATMFQMDGVIQQCLSMMAETLSACTVCTYYRVCQAYGLNEMGTTCMNWLTRNFLCCDKIDFIKDIDLDLMSMIISSPQLFVIQMEIDIYTLLKRWIFLQQNPTWSGEYKDILKDASKYLQKVANENSTCYLATDEGKQYLSLFTHIRWHYVINDITGLKMIENDKVLPMNYLDPVIMFGWRKVLSVEQGHDEGPSEEISEAVFNENCVRCGRILLKDSDYCWRWMGYNYGFDLLVVIVNRVLSVKRNTHTETYPRSVSLQASRHLCYRITLSSVDADGKEIYKKSTGIKRIVLGKNEEDIALMIDLKQKFPIAVSMNVLFLKPSEDDPIPKLKLPDR
ncbi:Germ cell-less protein-like 1 [Mactra antiquata]